MSFKTSRRAFVQSLSALMLLPSAHSSNAQINLSGAINLTARFRALSQRIAKAYVQIYLGVLPDNARKILVIAQRLVQTGFEELAKGQFPSEITSQINAIQTPANALNGLVAKAPNKEAVSAVVSQADKMLALADTATRALEGLSRQASVKIINLAGRQRMLSQRLAKNYFLPAMGLGNNATKEQLSSDSSEFKRALASLNTAPISTIKIRNELVLAQSQWVFFENAINRTPDILGLTDVATTSERLLDVMNNLTGLYDDALKDVLG